MKQRKLLASTKNGSTVTPDSRQENVSAYLQSQSSYWKDVYAHGGVQAEIYRTRQETVLSWIDTLALAPGSSVLEVGCGAGLLSVALAQRGFRVHAIDATQAMVELTRQHAQEAGMSERLSAEVGDAYALTFADSSFDLVVTLGVIPWLAQPDLAMREMARVIRPNGHLILTADNRARLIYLFEPRLNPALEPLRIRIKGLLEQVGLLHPSANVVRETLHTCRFIDEALSSAGLMKVQSTTIGFGPFRFLGLKVFPHSLDIALHRRLQRLADRSTPFLRSRGAQYLVLARK